MKYSYLGTPPSVGVVTATASNLSSVLRRFKSPLSCGPLSVLLGRWIAMPGALSQSNGDLLLASPPIKSHESTHIFHGPSPPWALYLAYSSQNYMTSQSHGAMYTDKEKPRVVDDDAVSLRVSLRLPPTWHYLTLLCPEQISNNQYHSGRRFGYRTITQRHT